MKKIVLLLALTTLMTGCFSSRPISQQEVKDKNKEAFQTTKAYMSQETKIYQKKIRVKLDQVGQKLKTVGEKAKKQVITLREKAQ